MVKDSKTTQGKPALLKGSSDEKQMESKNFQGPGNRRPPRNLDTSHLSDAEWERQSPDPRDRRG